MIGKVILIGAALPLALAGHLGTAIAVPPRIEVRSPSATVPAYDTIYTVTATAYGTNGRRSPTSVITWAVRPAGILSVTDLAAHGQVADVAAEAPGSAFIVATWKRSDGIVLRDSLQLTALRPRVVRVRPFVVTAPGVGVFDTVRVVVGQRVCAYRIDYDRRGGILTGSPSSSDAPADTGMSPALVVNLPCP